MSRSRSVGLISPSSRRTISTAGGGGGGGGVPDREMCMRALMGMDLREGGPGVELGYAFLKEWYRVFDLGRRTISFARSKPL